MGVMLMIRTRNVEWLFEKKVLQTKNFFVNGAFHRDSISAPREHLFLRQVQDSTISYIVLGSET